MNFQRFVVFRRAEEGASNRVLGGSQLFNNPGIHSKGDWAVKVLLASVFLFLLPLMLRAEESMKTAELKNGLILKLFSPEDIKTPLATRHSRLLSFYNDKDKAPSPFLKAGPFVARWEGFFGVDTRGNYTFHATGQGQVLLTIQGEEVLNGTLSTEKALVSKEVRLSGKNLNPVVLTLRSDKQSDTSLSLKWSSEEIKLEPIPFSVLRHNPNDSFLQVDDKKKRGRDLFARLRCANCHLGSVSGMLELEADSPSLIGIGSRVSEAWMANWILDPKGIQDNAYMPKLLNGKTAPQEAADIAAYLAAAKDKTPEVTHITGENTIDKGEALYAALGCGSCHSFNRVSKGNEDFGRIPQDFIAAKWKPAALKEFLREPQRHYKWIRMPDFNLTELEAEALAAYLIKMGNRLLPATPQGNAVAGKKSFTERGCANCHTHNTENISPVKTFNPLENLRGRNSLCQSVEYSLNAQDQEALKVFLAAGFESLNHHHPESFALTQVDVLRCTACHEFDGRRSYWEQVKHQIGEAEIDQHELGRRIGMNHIGDKQDIPRMTWFGEKLKYEWMTGFIEGSIIEKPRMGVMARMPRFPAYAKGISAGLSQSHGLSTTPQKEILFNEREVGLGSKVVIETACMTCHVVDGKEATGGHALQTIDLKRSPKRLRFEFFLRWMADPLRIEPTTMMPEFMLGDDNPKAIWAYMLSLEEVQK